jgi:chloramphenicol 3-O phosphotransferase
VDSTRGQHHGRRGRTALRTIPRTTRSCQATDRAPCTTGLGPPTADRRPHPRPHEPAQPVRQPGAVTRNVTGLWHQGGVRRNAFPARWGALYCGAMTTQVIVLNGGSSSGKSGIARCLQAVLPDPWLAVGVDTLVQAMPASMQTSDAGIEIAADGGVSVGPGFRTLEAAWMEGVAAMVRAGARVIIDEVFLGGAASQQRWQHALHGLDVLWVGVRCASAVAAGREVARGDRVRGMAVSQSEMVHQGLAYDLEVDTTRTESLVCARTIAAQVR